MGYIITDNKKPLNLIYYFYSTKPNQFCLEIILCHIRGTFDDLMYPYYLLPIWANVIGVDTTRFA